MRPPQKQQKPIGRMPFSLTSNTLDTTASHWVDCNPLKGGAQIHGLGGGGAHAPGAPPPLASPPPSRKLLTHSRRWEESLCPGESHWLIVTVGADGPLPESLTCSECTSNSLFTAAA